MRYTFSMLQKDVRKSISYYKKTFASDVVSIAVFIATFFIVVQIAHSIYRKAESQLDPVALRTIEISSKDGAQFDEARIDEVKRTPGVANAAPAFRVYVDMLTYESASEPGVDVESAAYDDAIFDPSRMTVGKGFAPDQKNVAVISNGLARRLGIDVDKLDSCEGVQLTAILARTLESKEEKEIKLALSGVVTGDALKFYAPESIVREMNAFRAGSLDPFGDKPKRETRDALIYSSSDQQKEAEDFIVNRLKDEIQWTDEIVETHLQKPCWAQIVDIEEPIPNAWNIDVWRGRANNVFIVLAKDDPRLELRKIDRHQRPEDVLERQFWTSVHLDETVDAKEYFGFSISVPEKTRLLSVEEFAEVPREYVTDLEPYRATYVYLDTDESYKKYVDIVKPFVPQQEKKILVGKVHTNKDSNALVSNLNQGKPAIRLAKQYFELNATLRSNEKSQELVLFNREKNDMEDATLPARQTLDAKVPTLVLSKQDAEAFFTNLDGDMSTFKLEVKRVNAMGEEETLTLPCAFGGVGFFSKLDGDALSNLLDWKENKVEYDPARKGAPFYDAREDEINRNSYRARVVAATMDDAVRLSQTLGETYVVESAGVDEIVKMRELSKSLIVLAALSCLGVMTICLIGLLRSSAQATALKSHDIATKRAMGISDGAIFNGIVLEGIYVAVASGALAFLTVACLQKKCFELLVDALKLPLPVDDMTLFSKSGLTIALISFGVTILLTAVAESMPLLYLQRDHIIKYDDKLTKSV